MKIFSRWSYLFLISLSFSLSAQENPSPDDNGSTGGQAAHDQEVQEIQYVTDKLRLSLYKKASAGSGTLKLLASGDELAVLEKSGPYSKVRTKAGLTGWVKNGFLVSSPTASFQLIEEQEKNRILAEQIEKYADTRSLVADYENTIEQMKNDTDGLSSELEQSRQQLQQLKEDNEELTAQLQDARQEGISLHEVKMVVLNYWYFIAASALLFVLIGFITGREIIEARVKRKFQGVKVW